MIPKIKEIIDQNQQFDQKNGQYIIEMDQIALSLLDTF